MTGSTMCVELLTESALQTIIALLIKLVTFMEQVSATLPAQAILTAQMARSVTLLLEVVLT